MVAFTVTPEASATIIEHTFEDIEVKKNAIDLLEYAFMHKRKNV